MIDGAPGPTAFSEALPAAVEGWDGFLNRSAGQHHFVQFYEDEPTLRSAMAQFVGAGLRLGEPVVVIATAKHRDAFSAELEARGVDLEAASRTGQLTLLDARETLARFM